MGHVEEPVDAFAVVWPPNGPERPRGAGAVEARHTVVMVRRTRITLGDYVRRHNGVPLGASGSNVAMFRRSLGAGSLASFWRHWNPVFGYYLARFVFSPLRRMLPRSFAVVLTFLASGLVHDAVMWLFGSTTRFLFTTWFAFAGVAVVAGSAAGLDYSELRWRTRMAINVAVIATCLGISIVVRRLLSIP